MVIPAKMFPVSSLLILFANFVHFVTSYQVEILNTRNATSDLIGWNMTTYVNNIEDFSPEVKWDEVTFHQLNPSVRGFQICPDSQDTQSYKTNVQNWLRSPYMKLIGRSRLYVELNFWMRECENKDTICPETFKIYYAITSHQSEVPQLNESVFTKIDTVAAEDQFADSNSDWTEVLNTEIVNIEIPQSIDISHAGVYVAIVDKGACIALVSVRVYSIVCPMEIQSLAIFPETLTGELDTSLVKVNGSCVERSHPANSEVSSQPVNHCTSDGRWNVRTGACYCEAGYQPDHNMRTCQPCPRNMYKPTSGNLNCTKCPSVSYTHHVGSISCVCSDGHLVSTSYLDGCGVCPQLPSPPLKLKVIKSTTVPGAARLEWEKPQDFGNCQKIFYCVLCQVHSINHASTSLSKQNNNSSLFKQSDPTQPSYTVDACDGVLYYPHQCSLKTNFVDMHNLTGHGLYTFQVVATNAVTHKHADSITGQDAVRNKMLNPKVSNTSSAFVTFSIDKFHPSTPTNLHMIHSNYTSVTIQWNPPVYTSGDQISYKIVWVENQARNKTAILQLKSTTLPTSHMLVNVTRAHLAQLNSGVNYYIAVQALSTAGQSNYSSVLEVRTMSSDLTSKPTGKPNNSNDSLYVYLVAVVSVLLFGGFVFFFLWRRCRGTSGKQKSKPCLDKPLQSSSEECDGFTVCTELSDQRTYVDPFSCGPIQTHKFSCETDPDLVSINKVIGCGEFGEVYQGSLTLTDTGGKRKVIDVAIKQLHAQCQPNEQIDFLHEAKALERFQHPNIVKLEAVVMASRPFMIVTELMVNGCLGKFLRHHRGAKRYFKPTVLVRMLHGVAKGMAYLSKMCYVHRDLAARNVLINNELVCKVADFGLIRHIGEKKSTVNTKGGKISLRWTAPEAVAYQAYSQASDVWSFGVFAWEVITYGEKPYWSLTNQQVLQAINDGYRLPAPEDCPSVLHQLMLECWHRDKNTRPTFEQVVTRLDAMINQRGVLDTLASPASTGEDVLFFTDSPPHTPCPVPTVTDGQSHHNYATCRIADNDSPLGNLIRGETPDPAEVTEPYVESNDLVDGSPSDDLLSHHSSYEVSTM
uniref:receptor protein-tyrosine kinase n=1 Tax=Ciona intestinalis TaxID=7719 RepID=Q4H3M3_CIOIN|nr:ephrin receptor like protein precursor [Ciona intestinalis]BAE06404.1 ephrin receptor like protein [Ciona intestinalis]|eukprot:NP_001071692.1 ephrin receptor like protein precursor [Ciona intestinalis]